VPWSHPPARKPQVSTPTTIQTPAPSLTPGPIVVIEQPDGSSKLMRAYRTPDGTVVYVPAS
jgi:hypothetical protein